MNTPTTWLGGATRTGPPATRDRTPPEARAGIKTPLQVAIGVGFAVVYLVAVGGRQETLIAGTIAAAAVMSVVSPVAGMAMFVIIMPMRETEIFEPFRTNAIIAAAIAFGCLLRFPIDRPPIRIHPGMVIVIGYLVISLLSLVPAVSGYPVQWMPSAANNLLKFATGVALFFEIIYLSRLMSVRLIVGLALIGASLAALLAIGDAIGFTPLEPLTAGLKEAAAGPRASGGFSNPNFLGLYMAPAAVFALGLLLVERRRTKLLLVPVIALLVSCVVVSFSRSALLGIAAGTVVLIAFKSRIAALVLMILLVIGAQIVYPAFLAIREGQILTTEDRIGLLESEQSRAAVATASLAIFAAYPVFGVGFGIFPYVSTSYTGGIGEATYSHDQYLNILAEQGIVGIVLIGAMIALLAIALARSRSPWRHTAMAVGVTYLVMSLFINSSTSFQSSSITWLVMAAALAAAPERTARLMRA